MLLDLFLDHNCIFGGGTQFALCFWAHLANCAVSFVCHLALYFVRERVHYLRKLSRVRPSLSFSRGRGGPLAPKAPPFPDPLLFIQSLCCMQAKDIIIPALIFVCQLFTAELPAIHFCRGNNYKYIGCLNIFMCVIMIKSTLIVYCSRINGRKHLNCYVHL